MTANPVLVTGAGGCIGAWILQRLKQAGSPAVGFDASPDRGRLELLLDDPAEARDIPWETGDIGDAARVSEVVRRHSPRAIIHLAALQVPYCIADPREGSRVNVSGTINVFAAAKECSVSSVAYASSVAATAMADAEAAARWKQTLYGAYKLCNEHAARTYWADDGIASIGIRPAVVYGPARDRGMSAAPTFAMLAAALGRSYRIPFTGPVGFVHAGEAAAAFIAAADAAKEGAQVFELSGIAKTVEETVDAIRARVPDAEVSCEGAPLPFPAGLDDTPLREAVGEYWRWPFEEGIAETLEFFKRRAGEGRIDGAGLEPAS